MLGGILKKFVASGAVNLMATLFAMGLSLFQLYTSAFGFFGAFKQRNIHLTFALILTFLLYPSKRKSLRFMDALFIGGALVAGFYFTKEWMEIPMRIALPTRTDIIIGAILIVTLLEATRRTIGITLPLLGIISLAYAYLGPYVPSLLTHRGYPLTRIVAEQVLTTNGLFGTPLGASTTFVAIFIIFAAFMEKSGIGSYFIELAISLFGWIRGGPAKAAVVASALMGTISGSAVANVVGTGSFTIPMMKSVGYRPQFAAAVEAAASSGGQLMPPVMGAAALIMVEITGIPYVDIIKAALIPAILFFLGIFMMVDIQAVKTGLVGIPRDKLPDGRALLRKLYLLLPLLILIYLMVFVRYTPIRSALWAVVGVVAVSFLDRDTRLGPGKMLAALKKGAEGVVPIANVTACAGIVVGVIMLTGLGNRLSSVVIALAAGMLPVLLVMSVGASIMLGMGLPTSAAYIILAILVAPAIVKMGVTLIAAHLFILYFGVLAVVTPPVALAAYSAAGLAGSDPMRTGFTAWKLCLPGFILPFMFIYNQELLMSGSFIGILFTCITAVIGIWALSIGLSKYLWKKMHLFVSVIFIAGAFFLIKPGLTTDIIGSALIGVGLLYQILSVFRPGIRPLNIAYWRR